MTGAPGHFRPGRVDYNATWAFLEHFSTLGFEAGSLTELGTCCFGSTDWPVNPGIARPCLLSSTGDTGIALCLTLMSVWGDLNSGPQAFPVTTLRIRPSVQPMLPFCHLIFFHGKHLRMMLNSRRAAWASGQASWGEGHLWFSNLSINS